MSFVRFKTLYRCKQTGEVSPDYVPLLPKCLTLDTTYLARRFFTDHRTLFKEIEIVPAGEAETQDMRELWGTPRPGERRQQTRDELFAAIYERFKQVVIENWTPGVQHVVLHSSGYDSRMLSWTLKRLHEERGDDWLGTVLFLCTPHEGRGFKEIMAYQGWREDQYHVEDSPRPELHASLTDFKNAWRRNGGAAGLPMNFFWYLPERAVEAGRLSDPVEQAFHSQWGNTCLDCVNGGQYRHKWRMFYMSMLCTRPMYGLEVIAPFSDVELARTVYQSSIKLGKNLRPALSAWLDTGLGRIANMDREHDRRSPCPPALWQSVVDSYRESWYGRHVAPDARPNPRIRHVDFAGFWSHWTAASLCEHLLAQGYEIKWSR